MFDVENVDVRLFIVKKKKDEEKRRNVSTTILFLHFLVEPLNMMCNFSTIDEWSRPALVSCQILTFIGVYLVFVFIAGVLLNILVLRSLLETRKTQSPIRIYMIALTFVDLLETILGIPLPLSSNFACR